MAGWAPTVLSGNEQPEQESKPVASSSMAAVDIVLVFMAIPCVFDRLEATASRSAIWAGRTRRNELALELALHIGAD